MRHLQTLHPLTSFYYSVPGVLRPADTLPAYVLAAVHAALAPLYWPNFSACPVMKSALWNLSVEHRVSESIRRLYCDFRSLEYFDRYGGSCFAMAALLSELLNAKGYSARVQPCYAVVSYEEKNFFLGYKGYARPGQIDGHVVCVVDEKYIVDFGLGSIRKYFHKDFYRAIACEIKLDMPQLATLTLVNGARIEWRTDWISPQIEAELEKQKEYVQTIVQDYMHYKKNRITFLINRMFRGDDARSRVGAA